VWSDPAAEGEILPGVRPKERVGGLFGENPGDEDSFSDFPPYGTLEWWRRVVDVDRLDEMMDRFADALHVGAIITTADGTPISRASNFSSFCKKVRSDGPGRFACFKSDADGGRRALEAGGTVVYECHCGLIDLASPLIVEGRIAGVILCGQVLLAPPEEAEARRLLTERWGFAPDPEALIDHYLNLSVVTERDIHASLELLAVTASHIVSLCERHLAERRLLTKSLALMREQRDREALERSLKLAQVQALTSRLNPHFLFNTLNTIARLALIEGAAKTQELTLLLADHLRYVLRKQSREDLVRLEEELACIERYLEIHRVRFGDRIRIRVSVDAAAKDVPIPFMLLQPLVENSVVHGLEPSLDPGHLTVVAAMESGDLVVDVSDDGMGCDPKRLTEGVGLRNVRERLSLHYGDRASLKIESAPGAGTRATVRIAGASGSAGGGK
jgi:ligand-binding sensor protein